MSRLSFVAWLVGCFAVALTEGLYPLNGMTFFPRVMSDQCMSFTCRLASHRYLSTSMAAYGCMSQLWEAWQSRPLPPPRIFQAQLSAIVGDFQALVSHAPLKISSWLPPRCVIAAELQGLIEDTSSFMKKVAQHLHGSCNCDIPVVSPIAGGSTVQKSETVDSSKIELDKVRVACLNPGKGGLSPIDGNNIIWWKAWDIASWGVANQYSLIVLPEVRFPSGVSLPANFPYCYIGPVGNSWSCVGLFVARHFCHTVRVLEGVASSDRRIWFQMVDVFENVVTFCGFYGPTGGDLTFFQELVEEGKRFGTYYALGDANIHLRNVVHHHDGCRCLHCQQKKVDRDVDTLFAEEGIECCNIVDEITFVSGTVIDLFLRKGPLPSPTITNTPPRSVAGSDHGGVAAELTFYFKYATSEGFGRVFWVTDDSWHAALLVFEPLFERLTQLSNHIMSDISITCWANTRSQINRRRSILNTLCWLRESWYAVAGHLGGKTKVSLPMPTQSNVRDLSVSEELQRMKRHHNSSWTKYVETRKTDLNQSQKFLSRLLGPLETFQIQLYDPDTGLPLDAADSMDLILDDFLSKSERAQPRDSSYSSELRMTISRIRSSGARVDPRTGEAGTVNDDEFYTEEEMERALKSLSASKYTFRGSLAAMKFGGAQAHSLNLALVNCSLQLQVSTSLMVVRQLNPIRKSGPHIVSEVKCLRAICQGTDSYYA